jgi:hypothetical protein
MRLLLSVALFVFAASAVAFGGPVASESNSAAVDLELVIAVDVSSVMNRERLALQREGYAQAITSQEFLQALKSGANGKVAITYLEWSGSDYQKVIVPWRTVDGPAAAAEVAAGIMKSPRTMQSRTSISGAMSFARSLFDKNPDRGTKRVINISGDGPNNSGQPVPTARDAVLAAGVVVDGMAIMLQEPPLPHTEIDHLDHYYEDCVTGGPGSFVVAVNDAGHLKDAIRSMIVSEVGGVTPEQAGISRAGQEPRLSCSIGEDMYERAWGRMSGKPTSAPWVPQTAPRFTTWQHAEFVAHANKCLSGKGEPILSRLDLSVTIGPDGMIVGDPEVIAPIDSDEFRKDVSTAIGRLRQCQPFIVDPFGRVRIQFTQMFKFGAERSDEGLKPAVVATLRKCYRSPRTGPAIWVSLAFKRDGTYNRSPMLFNAETTPEYKRTSADVVRQLLKCPPVNFPKGKYPNPDQLLRIRFDTLESAKASKSKA